MRHSAPVPQCRISRRVGVRDGHCSLALLRRSVALAGIGDSLQDWTIVFVAALAGKNGKVQSRQCDG
jgi:hypothetical protein